jgi:hypothetical protein
MVSIVLYLACVLEFIWLVQSRSAPWTIDRIKINGAETASTSKKWELQFSLVHNGNANDTQHCVIRLTVPLVENWSFCKPNIFVRARDLRSLSPPSFFIDVDQMTWRG